MSETVIDNFITIGKQKILVENCELNQADLKFYPENPRVYSALNSDGSIPSQEDIEEYMKKQDHVRELRDEIEFNGGLMESIYVRDGDYVVLEGNSRLAAYRMLAEKNAIKWGKIKCNLLPKDISDNLVFKLIGQFHIKGKKPWDAYEQASYLYRRCHETKTPIDIIANELNIKVTDAKKMTEAVELMKTYEEPDTHKYSYYFEYVKDSGIRKYRQTNPDIDKTIITSIKKCEIEKAEDIRLLGKIAKVGDKQSKKLMKYVIEGKKNIYEAHNELNEVGKFEASVSKLKSFKEYINGDVFINNIKSSEEVNKQAMFEIKKIISRLENIRKTLGDN